MGEARAIVLLTVGIAASMLGIFFGLRALGANDQQIAAGWMVCAVVTGLAGGFVVSHYSHSNDRR